MKKNSMKIGGLYRKGIGVALLFGWMSTTAFAESTEWFRKKPVADVDTYQINADDSSVPEKFILGIHTGLDLGAAVPWPVTRLADGSYKFSATPKISPQLGISYTMIFSRRLSASVEVTYKTVAIDANTWVKNQRFTIDSNPEHPKYQYFTGTADALMSFSMIEVPLYLRYTFKRDRNRIILGGYYSYILKGRFNTIAKKGVLNPDFPLEDDTQLDEGSIVTAPVGMQMDDKLGHWDIGMVVGYERKILNRLNFGARFMMGFKDIFDEKCLEYAMWHMRGSFVLSWELFRK